MKDLEKIVKAWERCRECNSQPVGLSEAWVECEYTVGLYCAQDKLVNETLELLKAQPQIVRCKDCKHRPAEPEGGADHGSDYIFPDSVCPCQCDGDPWYSWMPSDNWFCPKGERKEGDGKC